MRLENYQEKIKGYHSKLSGLFFPGGGEPDPRRRALADVLSKHAVRVKELDHNAGPSVMFYGDYNAGKSTLLNAVMGKAVAEVKDVPATDKSTAYSWNGYKLFDTPGIGAPIEHEEVADEKLEHCDVILFVVSTQGSFERKEIYERMRYIVGKKKKLLIALNNKSGLNQAGLEGQKVIQNIRDKVLRNLGESGKHSVIVVNAQDALEGRLRGDEALVRESGVEGLETAIVREIRRVNGYKLLYKDLRNLIDNVDPQAKALFSDAARGESADLNNALRELNEGYWAFITEEGEIVRQKCSGLASALFAVFPKEPGEDMDKDALRDELAKTQERYQNAVFEAVRVDLGKKIQEIVSSVDKFPREVSGAEKVGIRGRELAYASPPASDTGLGSAPSAAYLGSDDVWGKAQVVAFSAGELLELLPQIPLPIAIPPIAIPAIPIPIIIAVIEALKILFGESKQENERRRVIEEAKARREAEERQQRARDSWRQELRDYCGTNAEEFVMALQSAVRKYAEDVLKPFVEEGRKRIGAQKESVRAFYALEGEYYALKAEIDATLEELSSQS
jgi:GTPase SAR1 family protein